MEYKHDQMVGAAHTAVTQQITAQPTNALARFINECTMKIKDKSGTTRVFKHTELGEIVMAEMPENELDPNLRDAIIQDIAHKIVNSKKQDIYVDFLESQVGKKWDQWLSDPGLMPVLEDALNTYMEKEHVTDVDYVHSDGTPIKDIESELL